MNDVIEERARASAIYMIETGATVRAAAKKFGIGKSTVHKDVAVRLKYIDRDLHMEVMKVLALNKEERHLRGGEATRIKYLNARGS